MRQRNEKFAKDARDGRNPTHLSRKQKLEKNSPINIWALGLICFVLIGGGTPQSLCSNDTQLNRTWSSVGFELVRIIFL